LKSETPNHLLKGILYLDCINLEEKLLPVGFNTKFNFSNQFFIDLSQVRFVELSAAAQLLLIIESYLKKSANIFIALPTKQLVEKEIVSKSYTEELKENILHSRKKANSFLKTIGFVKAIQDISKIYTKEIYISEVYNFEKEFNLDSFHEAFEVIFENIEQEYSNYKFIFPFEWINCYDGLEQFNVIEKRLTKILENNERGLDTIDVKGIKNVILSELVKNVKEHSTSEYALLTVGLIKSNSLFNENINKKPNPLEAKYINWLKENNIPSQIEIYFGDSGTGILTKDYIEKYNIDSNGKTISNESRLKLSFQKWTTLKENEPRRGTKGLYRIQRIVNKYNGIFHITTSKLNGGFQKGGFQEEHWDDRKSKLDIGTFIQIKLCPYTDVKEFRYFLENNNSNKKWKTVQYKPKQNQNFLKTFKYDVRTNDNLLVILNIIDYEDGDASLLLEDNLKEFSFDSHPCAIVLYILSNLKNDTIQTIVDSVNTKIINKVGNDVFQEASHWDSEDVFDPVLVIGDKNETFWYGGNQNLINLLNESQNKYDLKLKYSELDEYKRLDPELKIKIRLHLENDNKLVNVDKDEFFNFNFTNIDKFFEEKIIKEISKNTDSTIKLYCTPKLEVVNNWLDISELVTNNEYGYALTLYLRYRDYLSNEIHNLNKNNVFILIDHKQQKEIAKAFASLLGVNPKNIKNINEDINTEIPKRTKLFRGNSMVIILTTIISSSETIRRLVKYIKRDSANSHIILCICNFRKYKITQLETWEEETPIISIFQKNNIEQLKLKKDEEYYKSRKDNLLLNFELRNPNFLPEISSSLPVIDENLRLHIVNNKLLHYNHIGIYKDRHFTFYLDKIRLLNIQSFIWNKLKETINKWESENKIKNYTIYLPKTILTQNIEKSQFLNFVKSLSKKVLIIDELINSIEDANVVYFDFGMMTGKAVNNVINKCNKVDNLFICILFNQVKTNEFHFYQRINSLNNVEDFTRPTPLNSNFKIEHLFNLPLSYFNSENCPICEHIKALEHYKLDNDYLYKFSEDRQQKLVIVEADEIQNADYPYDFYYSLVDIDHELSSDLIMKMYEFKVLLEKAEGSTQHRIFVYNHIYKIYNEFDKYIQDCNSELYAVIYFLSHEINWLQKEPLVFRDLRDLLANIAFKISIIDRNNLASILENTNNCKTSSDKLAIRYKYSSISLLRSTNKLLFCQSISAIIFSSKSGEYISNNIIQNTLYHITSLFKNKYNRSAKYFENIQKELTELSKDGLTLSISQRIAIQKIYLINQTKLKDIAFKGTRIEFIYIKKLRTELLDVYKEHHPKPIEFFHKIYLKRYLSIFTEYEKIKENARNYSTLYEVKTKLVSYWKSTLEFLNNSIFFYLEKLDEIRNSQFFRNNFSNSLNLQEYYQISDRFTELIYLIEEDLSNYSLYNQEYDLLWEKIYNTFIKVKGHQGENLDSKTLNLVSFFPTNLLSIVETVFPISIFPKREINGIIDIDVFYPNNEFLIHMDLVKNNIEAKKNKGVEFSDILIHFNIIKLESNQIELIIKYDSTDQYSQPESKNGSLSNWKKEVVFFQAYLDYKLPTLEDKNFTLTLKLLNYE
jgi:hypothetical protein